MLKRRLQVWAAVITIIGGTVVLACSTPVGVGPGAVDSGATADAQGRALVQDRCAQHHNLARVEAASKTPEEWLQTVERMVGKGAKLSADEQDIVVGYLAATYGP